MVEYFTPQALAWRCGVFSYLQYMITHVGKVRKQPTNHVLFKKGAAKVIYKVTHCVGHVFANTRPR